MWILFIFPVIFIFFGGGTPSLMQPKVIAEIINHLQKKTTLDQNIEITHVGIASDRLYLNAPLSSALSGGQI